MSEKCYDVRIVFKSGQSFSIYGASLEQVKVFEFGFKEVKLDEKEPVKKLIFTPTSDQKEGDRLSFSYEDVLYIYATALKEQQ